MRFLVKVTIPVEAGNAAAKASKLGSSIQSLLSEMKPEAAYFTTAKGKRTGYIVMDLQSASQMVAVAEPWFIALNAGVQFYPVMTPEDLGKAGPAMDEAVKKYK